MKTSHRAAIGALLLASPAPAAEVSGGGMGAQHLPQKLQPTVGRTVDDETLKKRQQNEKFGGLAPEGSLPEGYSLMSHSEFISSGGSAVILPKGSVLHVPERLKTCITAAPVGKIVTWPEFLAAQRGVVSAAEVTIEEATGRKPLAPQTLEALQSSHVIRVATLNRCPISVARPAPSAPAPTAVTK